MDDEIVRENVLKSKSYAFALRVVKLYKYLSSQKEYVLSRQVLRSGTAVEALMREAEFGQFKADLISKLSIGFKEANETRYQLSLLRDSEYIDKKMYDSISPEIEELIRMLVSSGKTAKKNREK